MIMFPMQPDLCDALPWETLITAQAASSSAQSSAGALATGPAAGPG